MKPTKLDRADENGKPLRPASLSGERHTLYFTERTFVQPRDLYAAVQLKLA